MDKRRKYKKLLLIPFIMLFQTCAEISIPSPSDLFIAFYKSFELPYNLPHQLIPNQICPNKY